MNEFLIVIGVSFTAGVFVGVAITLVTMYVAFRTTFRERP